MTRNRVFIILPVVGLAAYSLYSWWVAPPKLEKYIIDPEVASEEIIDLIHRRTRRGTRGDGRLVKYQAPITECSLESEASSLLLNVGRSTQVYRDVQTRLLATAKLDGITINGEMFGPRDLCNSEVDGVVLPPVVSHARLLQAVVWSIHQAKTSDLVMTARLQSAAGWVEDQLMHQSPHTITGRVSQWRLRLEWKVRTFLGLNLPLPSQ
jgi:hypothetical protein